MTSQRRSQGSWRTGARGAVRAPQFLGFAGWTDVTTCHLPFAILGLSGSDPQCMDLCLRCRAAVMDSPDLEASISSASSRGRKSKIKVSPGWVSTEASHRLTDSHFLTVSSQLLCFIFGGRTGLLSLSVQISSYKDTSLPGLGSA
jgi:hypothetical protein